MLSQEAELALGQLESGAVLNPIHTTARELINAGLAVNDWGRLALTEAGRRRIRRRGGLGYEIHDHVGYENPMGLGPEVSVAPIEIAEVKLDIPDVIKEAIVRPATNYDRALQAAGVASGITGIWPETQWVHAFMDAWVESFNDEK